jgi:uncharacterized membrane protein YsdA (DUF1294 family)
MKYYSYNSYRTIIYKLDKRKLRKGYITIRIAEKETLRIRTKR